MMGHNGGLLCRVGRVGALAMVLAVAGCAAYDRTAGLERADYENLMARRGPEQARPAAEPPIPELQPILAAPTPPELADQRRVSVQVTQATPVQDLLIELARKAGVDLDLDPRIEGGIILQANERPFEEVVRRIADLAGLRYTFADNVLRVELDEPYMQHYRVDMLNLVRKTTSKVDASTDVFSALGTGGAIANGSATSVQGEVTNDFWEEVKTGIEAIVDEKPPALKLVTGAAAPAATATATPTAAPTATGAEGAGAPEGAPDAMQAASEAAAIAAETNVAAASATPTASTASGGTGADDDTGQYYTINRPAGIITVQTTQAKHRRIQAYLNELRRAMQAQVLIEAKVVEVALDEEFRAGIDWSFVNLPNVQSITTGGLLTGVVPTGRLLPTVGAAFQSSGGSLKTAVDLLDTFGTSRTLSSPRLTVVNNETALLKVAENQVFFTLQIEREIDNDTGNETRTFTSELRTVPIGLLMQVQPSINLDSKQISLNLRPTISRIVGQAEDPAVQLTLADINAGLSPANRISIQSSPIPVVEVREVDSVVTLESGAVLVMGGLMQERKVNEDEKVPGLGDVPLVGNAFKKQIRETQVTELVIFLRATIVQGRDSVHQADVDLYNTFSPDPRPIGF